MQLLKAEELSLVSLKGSALIRVIDSRTLEVKDERRSGNLIFDATLLSLLNWEPVSLFASARISISTQNTTPQPNNPTLTGIIGTGTVPSGTTSPQYYTVVTPPFGEIRNIINAVGFPRTFYTVGLTTLSSADNQNNLSTTALAYLQLDLPCTQGQFDFLDIYYRIEFLNAGQKVSQEGVVDFGRECFGTGRFKISDLFNSWAKVPTAIYKNLPASSLNQLAQIGPVTGWTTGARIDSHFKWKQTLSQVESWQVGSIFNLMLTGNSNANGNAYRWEKYPGKATPIQNGFFQKSGSTKPFFDPTNFGSSTGKILLSEQSVGSWGDRFPEFYRFNIIAGGTVGTATYRFSTRKFLGFSGNTYTDVNAPSPFRNTNQPAADGFHGWRVEDNDPQRYSATQIVQYDLSGVTLLNLVNGNYQNWDATTTPALPCSQIRQVATNGSRIWVGCRSTGLWEIDPAANTVTQRIGSPCYGVDVGRNNKVWTVVEGGLRNSDAWLTNVAFAFTGISDNNWSRVQFLKADPENASDRIALIAEIVAGSRRVVWWDAVSTASVAGYQGTDLRSWPANFDVSDTGGFWASNARRHTFGSATTTAIASPPAQALTHSVYGSDTFFKISFFNGFFIGQTTLVNTANVTQNTYTPLGTSATLLHMDGGITLLSTTMRQVFTDNIYCWQDYGWNGAEWQLGNTNPKTTHLDDQALINGLQVKFTNGANPPHFFATDFFTVGVCHGLLKDSATTFYWQSAWYTKPARFDVPIPDGVTIPSGLIYTFPAASDGAFLFMETDSPKLYKFAIAGVPVPTVYTNNENPAPGEVTINSAGFAKFNAADVGKALTGTYAWVGYL